jgi:hypothetical protein
MKKAYIAGKITGLPIDRVSKKFNDAERFLINQGYQVINPIKINLPDTEWNEAMRKCIGELVKCDIIYTLPCWRKSKGARLEVKIAKQLGLKNIREIL